MTAKRATAQPGKEAHGLYMLEKYERVIEYLYPIAQNIPRKHGVFRDLLIEHLFHTAQLLADAIKVNQLNRCYLFDSAIAQLRMLTRFMVHHKRKMITEHQLEVAQGMIAEVGSMLGKWICRLKKKTRSMMTLGARGFCGHPGWQLEQWFQFRFSHVKLEQSAMECEQQHFCSLRRRGN